MKICINIARFPSVKNTDDSNHEFSYFLQKRIRFTIYIWKRYSVKNYLLSFKNLSLIRKKLPSQLSLKIRRKIEKDKTFKSCVQFELKALSTFFLDVYQNIISFRQVPHVTIFKRSIFKISPDCAKYERSSYLLGFCFSENFSSSITDSIKSKLYNIVQIL